MHFRKHVTLLISLLINLLVPNKDVAVKFPSYRLGSAGTLVLYGMTSGGESSVEMSILPVIVELSTSSRGTCGFDAGEEKEKLVTFSRGKGRIRCLYVHVAVGSNTFSIVYFRGGGGVVHWGGRVAMGSVGAGARSQTSALYVVGIIFWPSRGSVGKHICSEIIEN